jgi:hypothetical protein
MDNTQRTEWTRIVTELQACAAGNRNMVKLTHERARLCGVAHSNLTIAARALGLVISTNGGTTATRPMTARF